VGAVVTRLAWFHCFAGIAGDMALGSLLDAGADLEEVRTLLRRLPVDGWTIDAVATMRCGLAATHAGVRAEDTPVVRTHAHIAGMIEAARLPPRVQRRALATFAVLAEVEGQLHRRHPSQVHFHEVGGIDAIVDVVGTCAALELLDIDVVRASAVATGTGMVRAAHGLLPNPAPAVVGLLATVEAPTYGRETPLELTTPTGAALLAALVGRGGFGPMPSLAVSAVGYGAGTRELDGMPNVTQVVIGTAVDRIGTGSQPLALLEANLDDATGETLAHAVAALLDAGAADAWIAPIVMKKGRPGHLVAALCDLALVDRVGAVLVRETGSLGVRTTTVERWAATRTFQQVDVDGEHVQVKVSPGRTKAEFDDAARVASLVDRPAREVVQLAEEAWRRQALQPTDGPEDAG
jgi:uncharacterized protein (TIGR00299 family) protein